VTGCWGHHKNFSHCAFHGTSHCLCGINAVPVLRAETDHFVVYSSYNTDITSTYAAQLEKLRYVLDAYYGVHDAATSEQKLTIYLLDVLNYPLLLERAHVTQFVRAFNLTECASGISVRSTLNRDLVKVNGRITNPTNVPSYLAPLNSGYSRLFLATAVTGSIRAGSIPGLAPITARR